MVGQTQCGYAIVNAIEVRKWLTGVRTAVYGNAVAEGIGTQA